MTSFEFLKKYVDKSLLNDFKNYFSRWVQTLDSTEKFTAILWGDVSIEPFAHQIGYYDGESGNFKGKISYEYQKGWEGLLSLKIKARRFKIGSNFINEATENGYYLEYINYVIKKVSGSYYAETMKDFLYYIKQIIEKRLKSYGKFRADKEFDKFQEMIIFILLQHLKNIEASNLKKEVLQHKSKRSLQVDLHLHSYYSDCGVQTIGKLIYTLFHNGVKYASLTDHNTFDGVLRAMKIGKLFGIKIIPGVEISVGKNNGKGFIEEFRDVLVYFPLQEDFLKWAKNDFDKETYDIFRNSSDRKNGKVLWGNTPIETVLKWAKKHNGVSILAHVGFSNQETQDKIIDLFNKGLDGLEIYNHKYRYPYHYPMGISNIVKILLRILKEYNHDAKMLKIFTLGTDSHAVEDISKYAPSPNIYHIICEELNIKKQNFESSIEFLERMVIFLLKLLAQIKRFHKE